MTTFTWRYVFYCIIPSLIAGGLVWDMPAITFTIIYIQALGFMIWFYHGTAHFDSINSLVNKTYDKCIAAIHVGDGNYRIYWDALDKVKETRSHDVF